MTLKQKNLTIATLIYIYIPVVIFLIGFTRLLICIPCLLALLFVTRRFLLLINDKCNRFIRIDKRALIMGVIILLLIGFFSGWGRWVNQVYDWYKHNAVLKDLVERKWPVYYVNGKETSMLTYYVGQYLVPAIVGKCFNSFRSAEVMLYIWNEIGLFLVWLQLLIFMNNTSALAQIFETICLIFFHVPQSLTELIEKIVYDIDNFGTNWVYINDGEIILQYSGNYCVLEWVFNQTIVPWLIVLLFLEYKDDIKMYLYFMLPMLIFAVLPLVGMVPLAVGYALNKYISERNIKAFFKEVFSLDNLLCITFLGMPLILYYYGNVLANKPASLSLRFIDYKKYLGVYFIFIICNVVLYACCLIRNYLHSPLFYLAFGYLLIVPLFSMGYYNDLVMRSSIPSLFIVMCFVIDYLTKNFDAIMQTIKKKRNKDRLSRKQITNLLPYLAVVALLVNAGQYQISMLMKAIRTEINATTISESNYGTLEFFANRAYAEMSVEERSSAIAQKMRDMIMREVQRYWKI